MRLTLRTLLAYLDNTVEPGDAEALRQKLQQSGFATQLVAAIRASIHAKTVSAPAPDSVHPIEEPNMMSEYLDSTLSPEQIAEVERSCLESEVNLAEAAACHQILTMILGKPANPSEAIKSRIYDMVDVSGNVVADFGTRSVSAIAGEIGPRGGFGIAPPSGNTATIDSSEQGFAQEGAAQVDREAETAAIPVASSFDGLSIDAPKAVPPVGVDDSGVFDAPTKLRKQTFATPDAGATLGETEQLAGDRPLRALEKSDFYEGDVRPSRITPWLVSLALVGVLLFAIAQIFQPLLGSRVAQNQEDDNVSEAFPEVPSIDDAEVGSPETVIPVEDLPPIGEWTDDGPPPIPESIPAGSSTPDVETLGTSEPDVDATESLPLPAPESASDLLSEPAPTAVAALSSGSTVDPMPSESLPSPETTLPAEKLPEETASVTTESGEMVAVADDVPAMATAIAPTASDTTPTDDVEPKPTVDDLASPEPITLAKLESTDALVGQGNEDGSWKLVAPDSEIVAGATVVCGPEYRANFRLAGEGDAGQRSLATIIGPTNVEWLLANQTPGLRLSWGRGMLRSTSTDASFVLVVEGMPIQVEARNADAVLAFELVHSREIGDNPLIPESHVSTFTLLSIEGDHTLTINGEPLSFDENERAVWRIDGGDIGEPELETVTSAPIWLDPDVDTGSLESEAASTLLELMRESSDSLLLSLRLALDFRRNEVAALAGKTMLSLNDASSYFGIDGLLSKPNQRLYWSSHLDAIREMVDRSDVDAMLVRKAIAGNEAMDNADGDILFRLLVGFSQDQLSAGEDATLVKALESGSMPVRVLASENLRDITGKTLYFKPEETIASRRTEVIRKWNVNLRRGQIRWPEPDAVATEPPKPAAADETEGQ